MKEIIGIVELDGQIYVKVVVNYSKLGINDWAQRVRWES